MNKAIFAVAGFVLGAAAGAAGSWYILRNRYEQITQEEIDSVKEVFAQRQAELNEEIKSKYNIQEEISKEEEDVSEELVNAYNDAVDKLDYSSYSKIDEPKSSENDSDISKKPEKKDPEKPYVISPDDFGEFDDYERISLTFYSDHILTDDADEPIEDIDAIVGFESLNHFGEYEDDSVFVRNDKLKCDYEILLDERKYREVL